jgi:hypothetical protein
MANVLPSHIRAYLERISKSWEERQTSDKGYHIQTRYVLPLSPAFICENAALVCIGTRISRYGFLISRYLELIVPRRFIKILI